MYLCPHCDNYFDLIHANPIDHKIVYCPKCYNCLQLEFKHPLISIGQVIDNFEIKELAGAGGMGWVYRAYDQIHSEEVAIKVLSPKYERNVSTIRKFLHEASLSLDLRHPNIIPTVKYGNKDGISYLASKYIEGKTVEQAIEANGSYGELEALRIIHNIASALKYAWDSHHILHRDIKPGNIMIEKKSRRAYLFDLGIALNIKETMSKDKDVEGSPYYISPEQARNVPLTFASDMYSLGITFYQMLAGKVPFYHKDIYAVIEMHVSMPLPSLRNNGLKLSQGTDILLRRMTAKKPTDRFHSWNDVLAVIEHIINSFERRKKVMRVPFALVSRKVKIYGLVALIAFSFFVSSLIINFIIPIIEANTQVAEDAFHHAMAATRDEDNLLSVYELHEKAYELSNKFTVKTLTKQKIRSISGDYLKVYPQKSAKEQRFEELAAKADDFLSTKGTILLTGNAKNHEQKITLLIKSLINSTPQTRKSNNRKQLLLNDLDQLNIMLFDNK